MGSGAGGLTKDALPLLDAGLHSELLQYVATNGTDVFSDGLQHALKSSKLHFEARPASSPPGRVLKCDPPLCS